MAPIIIAGAAALVAYGLASAIKGKFPKILGTTAGGNPVVATVSSPLSQAAVNPVTGAVVPAGTPPFAKTLQTDSPAVPSAHALHDWLKANPPPAPVALVQAFEAASNADPMSVALNGTLPVAGVFDAKTSAALTTFTGDPIAPDPAAPPPAPPATFADATNMSVPGNAATSSFNLIQYLHVHGNDKSTTEAALVKQFQLDVNTDPKFFGPAALPGLPKLVTSKLAVTGVYDVPTAQALKFSNPDGVVIQP